MVLYAPVDDEMDKVDLSRPTSTQVRVTAATQSHNRDFGQGSGAWHSRVDPERPKQHL